MKTRSPQRLALRNATQSVTFVRAADGWRPEWFRLGRRPMLRFKDHEFLNVGGVRVTAGELARRSPAALDFAGRVEFAGVAVQWTCRVARPADGGPGFTVTTHLLPLQEPVELLEGLTAFETPYEYDGNESLMTVMTQQPVYKRENGKDLSGAGWMHPNWYYGRAGRAHLTYPSASPLMLNRVAAADGSNERCTMLIGNWNVCTVKDLFAQPTRSLGKKEGAPALKPGCRGMKFLVGAVNWNTSLHKDPNLIVDPGHGLQQEVTVDFRDALPGRQWDAWLAAGWERLCRVHFPADGHVGAWEVAKGRGAGWIQAATWLTDQFAKEEGCPGFFNPERGPNVYAPHTRPKWDNGVEMFAGQWTGPVSYLGHVWGDERMVESSARLERLFCKDRHTKPGVVWTIGPTPMFSAVMRKAHTVGVSAAALEKVRDYVCRRTEIVLNPPPDSRRGDPGILAWDSFANLLAADLFDRRNREAAARELLARVNARLDGEFWSFNCAAEGDLVGAGQGRPFGHGIAMAANLMAWRRFGDAAYLRAGKRFGNLLLGMHYIAWNESPSPDLDTRGWCHGSTGGRDQTAQLPPWETSHALQQFAHLMHAGEARDGIFDACWLFAHTGLAMFPAARTMKRLYTPQMGITYRPIESVASERAFYLSLPYLAYENPWDQTMLAGYQGVEPIILSLFLGGGLVRAEDDRVAAFVPAAPLYDKAVARRFTAVLWNPTAQPVETRLYATLAVRRRKALKYAGPARGTVTAKEPWTRPLAVPSRKAVEVTFEA